MKLPSEPADTHDLLSALVNGKHLETAVPRALDFVARDPLALVRFFRGDALRGLMEVPGWYWTRHPSLYDRYREALRAAAVARLRLPLETRHEFWSPLELREEP